MTIAQLPADIMAIRHTLHPLSASDRFEHGEGDPQPAAVLILLAGAGTKIHFPLTVRPISLRSHPGQISLPGGRAEPGDVDLWQTAIRETEEELGVNRNSVNPLGRLDDLHLRRSNHLIAPFVGWLPCLPTLCANNAEVEYVIDVTLSALLDAANIRRETWDIRGRPWSISYYQIGEHRVWGATASMLSDLVERRLGNRLHPHWRPGDVAPLEEV